MKPTLLRAPIIGATLLVVVGCAALLAPLLAPNDAETRFADLLNAPPNTIHVVDASGHWRAPFIYRWRLISRLEQRYEVDDSVSVPIQWLSGGKLATSSDERVPLLLLGSDSYGRDVFARLLHGARVSLGVSLVAALGALVLGVLIGSVAGYTSGITDDVLMSGTHFVLLLPATYVALALRAALPLVLEPREIFVLLTSIFALLGSPTIAAGVRHVVRTERARDYAVAAMSLGAGPLRVLSVHLIPAAQSFLKVQLALLVPSFIVAEATLSYVGLGFPDRVASWGTMLQEASSVRALGDFPWLLSPAFAMFTLVLGLNLIAGGVPVFSLLGSRRLPDTGASRR